MNNDLKRILRDLRKGKDAPVGIQLNLGEDGAMRMKGEPGYTPQKGVDYWTREEINEMVETIFKAVKPNYGVDYYTESDKRKFVAEVLKMATPVKGVHYRDGIDGKDGKDGKDAEEIDARRVAIDAINFLETFEGDARLSAKALKDLEEAIEEVLEERGEVELSEKQINSIKDLLPQYPPQNAGGSGATFLKSLRDVDLSGLTKNADGKYVLGGGSGASTFLGLTDTPSAYTGQASKVVAVNATEDGLEFTTISASGLTDGDKGDITVSASGATWTIDNQAVTRSKMEHIQENHFLGRHAAGTGDVQEVSPTQARTILSISNVDNTSDATKNAAAVTLTNKTIALGSNTVSGTLAQLNTAITDADLAITTAANTFTGTQTISGTSVLAVLNDTDAVLGGAASARFHFQKGGNLGTLVGYNGATDFTLVAYDGNVTIAADHDNNEATSVINLMIDGSVVGVVEPAATATQASTVMTRAKGDARWQLLDSDLTAIAALSPADDDFIQRKGGVWTNRTVAQVKADLGLTGITRSITVTSGNVSAGAVASTDYVYIVAGAHIVTLPTAVGNTNLYTINNSHTSDITLATTSSQTINGVTAPTLIPDQAVQIISDGTNWRIV